MDNKEFFAVPKNVCVMIMKYVETKSVKEGPVPFIIHQELSNCHHVEAFLKLQKSQKVSELQKKSDKKNLKKSKELSKKRS